MPFDTYAQVAHSLCNSSSTARALAAGAHSVERFDRLVQAVAAHKRMRFAAVDQTVECVSCWLERNRRATRPIGRAAQAIEQPLYTDTRAAGLTRTAAVTRHYHNGARTVVVTALAAILMVTMGGRGAIAGPFEDGVSAYRRGNYAAAMRLTRPLADQGNALAQYNLAVMHASGLGVPQDSAQAHKWSSLAAARFPDAQAADRAKAITNRDLVAGSMTPAQIAEAQRLASQSKPK